MKRGGACDISPKSRLSWDLGREISDTSACRVLEGRPEAGFVRGTERYIVETRPGVALGSDSDDLSTHAASLREPLATRRCQSPVAGRRAAEPLFDGLVEAALDLIVDDEWNRRHLLRRARVSVDDELAELGQRDADLVQVDRQCLLEAMAGLPVGDRAEAVQGQLQLLAQRIDLATLRGNVTAGRTRLAQGYQAWVGVAQVDQDGADRDGVGIARRSVRDRIGRGRWRWRGRHRRGGRNPAAGHEHQGRSDAAGR